MLHLYTDRNLEALVAHYADIAATISEPVFTKQIVVTPNKMIGRWLQQRMAQANGISVNLEPTLPATYAWQLMREAIKELPENSSFSIELLQFSILDLLEDTYFTNDFPRLSAYLKVCTHADKMALAGKVARVFDHYQVYRGDWLIAWSQENLLDLGDDERWQQAMWSKILLKNANNNAMEKKGDDGGGEKYRSQLEEELLDAVKNKTFELPKTLCIFGVSNLQTNFIKLVQALSKHCECHLFAFSVADEVQNFDNIPSEIKHWHRTGDDFFAQINTQVENKLFKQENNTQLKKLQNCLAGSNLSATKEEQKSDQSLLAVNCFSETREVEAIYDYLVSRFTNNPSLKSDDVMVAVTDLEKYAPFIRAVFDTHDEQLSYNIPYVINGSLASVESPLVNGLLELLEIPSWRFTREQVMVLARNRLIQKRFVFNDESLDQIEVWLDEAGVRWGVDAAHKQSLGLPSSNENTWRAGLDRLLLGVILPKACHAELPLFNNVLPVDEIEGELTDLLSQFVSYCESLFYWREQFSKSYTVEEWQILLQRLINDFFAIDAPEEDNHLQLLEMFDQLKSQTDQIQFKKTLDNRAMSVLINDRIGNTVRSGRFAGVVNFTSMNNLAGIPFKHVCLLGMNYDAWPSSQREPGFDLLHNPLKRKDANGVQINTFRVGDRNIANDERYLTLQLIMSAQESLYISYVGRNIHSGNEVPPSVLVSELESCCQQNGINLSVHQHAMHVYSAGNYIVPTDGAEKHALHSHNPAWLNVARRIGRGEKQIEPLFPLEVNEEEKTTQETPSTISHIDFEDLSRFFQNPQSNFLRNKLRVYIQDESNDWNNVEPFDLSNFSDSNIRSIALTQEKAGQSNTGLIMAKASAQLPQGLLGEMLQQTEQETVDELLEIVKDQYPDFFTQTLSDYVADLTIENFNITGVLSGLRPAGQILLISDRLYAWRKVQLWLKHLLLCCAKPEGVSCTTQLIGLDGTFVFGEVEAPENLLVEWLVAYQQGQRTPLPFFAKTSFEYANAFNKNPNQEAALKKAEAKWWDSFTFPGECSKPANEFLYRGHSPLNEEFSILAESLLCPLLLSGAE